MASIAKAVGTHDAPPTKRRTKTLADSETIMKRTAALISAMLAVASTCAFAQTNSGNVETNKTGQNAQQSTGGNANSNNNQGSGGTLMQKREKGMSPEAASGSSATGKMKQ